MPESKSYYHGSSYHRFQPGEIVVPGSKISKWSNWTIMPENLRRELRSGRVVHPQDVVWITSDEGEALSWAEHSTLKATPADIRRSGAEGFGVYEVEPLELDFPVDQHSRLDAEACCASARVVREVSFDAFELDLCDECGEPASVGMGTDEQLCADCATEAQAQTVRRSLNYNQGRRKR